MDVRFISQALRRVRQAAGFLQVDVAERSGLTRAMVSAYEAGKSTPSMGSLSAYLGAIGRDLGDLQDEVNRLSGRSRDEPAEDRERAVGRAVLKAFRVLGLDLVSRPAPSD
ncbi:MAG TPA: helix-turn-helix transcriptional regulator [Thermoanaerobaculia bacterium]|nr:helix-turn-helix transcriptional regulator [Thermoanaerobaculia bacterium]